MKVTQKDLKEIETVINNHLDREDANFRIKVEYAYGQPRAYKTEVDKSVVWELSPRLPVGELYRWLDAYYTGLTEELKNENR